MHLNNMHMPEFNIYNLLHGFRDFWFNIEFNTWLSFGFNVRFNIGPIIWFYICPKPNLVEVELGFVNSGKLSQG